MNYFIMQSTKKLYEYVVYNLLVENKYLHSYKITTYILLKITSLFKRKLSVK